MSKTEILMRLVEAIMQDKNLDIDYRDFDRGMMLRLGAIADLIIAEGQS